MNELDNSITRLTDIAQRVAPEMVAAKHLEATLDLAMELLFVSTAAYVLIRVARKLRVDDLSDSEIASAVVFGLLAGMALIISLICIPESVATINSPSFYALKDLLRSAK